MKRIIPMGIVLSARDVLTASASAGTIGASAVITAKPDGSDYSEGPLKGDGQQILASFASVPEPSTLTLRIVGRASLAAVRLLRRKGAA